MHNLDEFVALAALSRLIREKCRICRLTASLLLLWDAVADICACCCVHYQSARPSYILIQLSFADIDGCCCFWSETKLSILVAFKLVICFLKRVVFVEDRVWVHILFIRVPQVLQVLDAVCVLRALMDHFVFRRSSFQWNWVAGLFCNLFLDTDLWQVLWSRVVALVNLKLNHIITPFNEWAARTFIYFVHCSHLARVRLRTIFLPQSAIPSWKFHWLHRYFLLCLVDQIPLCFLLVTLPVVAAYVTASTFAYCRDWSFLRWKSLNRNCGVLFLQQLSTLFVTV